MFIDTDGGAGAVNAGGINTGWLWLWRCCCDILDFRALDLDVGSGEITGAINSSALTSLARVLVLVVDVDVDIDMGGRGEMDRCC